MTNRSTKVPAGEVMNGKSADGFAPPREGVRLLREAFVSFNTATARLEKSYQDLEKRVDSLNRALEEKNRELKRNLRETEKVRSYLHNILESLNSGVLVLDGSGRITTGNGAVERITGLDAHQIIGRRFLDLEVFEDSSKEILRKIVARPGQGYNCEVEITQKCGTPLHVNLSSSPMKNCKTRVSGRVVVLQDIERLKTLEEQAERTGRLSAMGDMAARIAHEVRNPLGSIELFASILRRELEGERKRLAEHLIHGVKSLNMILTNLLYFFRGSLEPIRTEIDFHRFLSDFLEEMALVMEKNRVNFRMDFCSGALALQGDPELLKQLFLNLLLNAIQAMPDGGELELATRLIREKVEILRPKHTDRPSDAFLEVRVSDTGPGVAEEIRSRIFDPFFTTRERGAGLGLAIAHNIMEAHGGTIRVSSGRQGGASFVMAFPLNHGKTRSEKGQAKGVS